MQKNHKIFTTIGLILAIVLSLALPFTASAQDVISNVENIAAPSSGLVAPCASGEYSSSNVQTCFNTNVACKIILSATMTDEDLAFCNEEESKYTAEKLRDYSLYYNCHSYAWYDQSESNNIWIDYPGAFLTDGVYEVSVSECRSGDRIVYYNADGPSHSGIIDSVSSPSLSGITVVSKWSFLGLYRHNVYECPDAVGMTDIKIFRTCYHSNGEYVAGFYFHSLECPDCGGHSELPHVWDSLNRCVYCGKLGSTNIEINKTNEVELQ